MRARLARLAELLAAAIFAVLLASLLAQVASRFVLGSPAAWTEEVATLAFLWTIFFAAAFTVPLEAHVAVDLLEARFGPRTRRVLRALGLAVLAGCFLWALPGVVDYTRFMLREPTPVLGLPFGWVYSVFPVFAAAFALRCLAAILRPPGLPPASPSSTTSEPSP